MFNFSDITKRTSRKTRLITAENVYGEKGKGGMADPNGEPQSEVFCIGQRWESTGVCVGLGQKWKVRPCISLPSNEETTIMDVDGPATIRHIWITMDQEYLRDAILRAYWDNEEEPSIEVPIGDFFGCPFKKYVNITAIPFNVNPTGGMNCYLPMPFRKHAKITVENRNPKDLGGFFYAISYDLGEVGEDELYMHAQFRRTNPLKYKDDYVIADGIKGSGHYVGTQLGWQQNVQGWWGEGEIKIFIDGDEEFPTYCGTGTEDYFGGAWCFGQNYSAPFLGYKDLSTLGDHPREFNTVGNRHSMYRYHMMDPIYFDSDLKVTIQAIGWRSEGRFLPLQDDICSVAYWYQTEPHNPFPALGSRNDLESI